MPQNKKLSDEPYKGFHMLAAHTGMLLMAAAAVTGMLELPNRPNNRVVLPGQPVYAWANESNQFNNPIQREREEVAPHYIDYSVTQRTPSRATKK